MRRQNKHRCISVEQQCRARQECSGELLREGLVLGARRARAKHAVVESTQEVHLQTLKLDRAVGQVQLGGASLRGSSRRMGRTRGAAHQASGGQRHGQRGAYECEAKAKPAARAA